MGRNSNIGIGVLQMRRNYYYLRICERVKRLLEGLYELY